MDLMLAAKALYDRWCQAHKGHTADGAPMPCWEALDGNTRATWTAVAETAYHHVRKCLDAVPARKPEPATTTSGLGAARVDVTVTCGAEVHRMSYEQALVDISCQPGRPGSRSQDRMQLELTGSRVSTP
jgi:hypothetical protein